MSRLTIQRIECIPLRMPLPRTFRGSSYFMTHRCTIITRVYTAEGKAEQSDGAAFHRRMVPERSAKITASAIDPRMWAARSIRSSMPTTPSAFLRACPGGSA